MTRSENIVSRWSRMKQQSARSAAPDALSSESKHIDAEAGDLNGATDAAPGTDPVTSPAFDPASLPPLQSITAGTDIRSFLDSNVPPELTKAALRRAWATDPAIRDFIGIAENQWDFNDPTAMPGFGPIRADDVPGLAGLGETEQAGAVTTEAAGAERLSATRQIDEIDQARAREYSLLAALLSRSPDAQMIEHLVRLSGDATQLGAAHAAISAAAASINPDLIEREYFDLFIGLGRGELLPYGSYYLTGFLHERPLARLRADLARLGIERAEGKAEPEDHAAILCEIMAGLVSRRFPALAGADRALFEGHMASWIGRFFADLEQAEAADFYRRVGMLGRVLIEIETEAFALPS